MTKGATRGTSQKRIHDADAIEVLAVGEVFGVERGATKGLRGGDDGGVPVVELVAATQGDGFDNEFQTDRKHWHSAGKLKGGIYPCLGDAEDFFCAGRWR